MLYIYFEKKNWLFSANKSLEWVGYVEIVCIYGKYVWNCISLWIFVSVSSCDKGMSGWDMSHLIQSVRTLLAGKS